MQAPWSRIPAVPAAAGLVCGIAAARLGLPLWWGAVAAVAAAALWLWRSARFFASAPAALALGLLLAEVTPPQEQDRASEAPAARSALARTVYASGLSGPAAAFVATTLVADGSYLQHSLRTDFRASGIAHVLALSGFHVGVVAMLAMWLTRPMLATGRARRLRPAAVLAAVWAFAALGGMSASIVRAAVMLSLLLAARLFGRYHSTLNSLAVAAVAILVWRPWALFDVGFQLSFCAVGGIVAFAGPLNPFSRYERPLAHAAAGAVAVPLGATLATAPIVAATFGSLPLLFLPANMLVAALFAPFYVLALAVVGLTACGIGAAPLVHAVDALYALMARAAGLLASPVEARASLAAVATAYAAIALFCLYLRRWRRRTVF